MRPVVSYEDITNPQPVSSQSSGPQTSWNSSNQPPAKKRKRNNNAKSHIHNNKPPARYTQHWDDPGTSAQHVAYGEGDDEGCIEGLEEEESRELTHEEIWDDSVLIEAWRAANEEYEVFHGPDKKWKLEPTHKSALWYNIPLSSSRHEKATSDGNQAPSDPILQEENITDAGQNSRPLNFDTFIPTYDASLSQDYPDMTDTNTILPSPDSVQNVTQDEAFSRALNAMYWTGYWTAVYHGRKNPSAIGGGNEHVHQGMPNGVGEEEEAEEEDSLANEDLVPSQR